MQLCANVQLPIEKGGISGTAIYIDTEGSFIPKRMQQIAQATHLNNWQSLLEEIQLFRVFSIVELFATINQLEDIVRLGRVKLIVIDSIAFHFRSNTHFQERTRLLQMLAQNLRRIASVYQIAIVIVNQMTTKMGDGRGGGGTVMIPALGDSWAHAATHRLILLYKSKQRCAWLCKSSYLEEGFAAFDITMNGITDTTPHSDS
jgi:RAD51-like protein 2